MRLTVLCLAMAAHQVSAQSVRGRSLSQIDSTPVAGVVVQLLSTGGDVVAQRLSDERGAFLLVARASGTYRLRGLRIGFRPSIGDPFQLRDTATVEHSILLVGVPVRLRETTVSASERCSSRADTNSLGFRAWEQARTALASALSTREELGYEVDYVSTERQWDDRRNKELSYSQVEKRSSSVRTFRARPLDVLADSGYVIRHGDVTTYAGPDEEVLLSEEFATHHCISAVPSGASADSIVLHFEPTPDRRLPDIRGTLVLSKATAELRSLGFEYANVEPAELGRSAGGQMSFLRLPGGGWVIREWTVVTPVMSPSPPVSAGPSLGLHYPGAGSAAGHPVFERVALHETRGELFRIRHYGDVIWSAPMVLLRGRVTDGRGDGQPGVSVRVLGARNGAVTDDDGRFTLREVRVADLLLDLRPSYADSLGIASRRARVVTSLDDSLPVRFEIPSRREAIVDACERLGTSAAREGEFTVLRGTVRGRSGISAADADLLATWRMSDGDSAHVVTAKVRTVGGEYMLCGAPAGRPVSLVASSGAGPSSVASTVLRAGAIALVDLAPLAIRASSTIATVRDSIVAVPTGTASLVGVVRTLGGVPVVGAQVRIAGDARVTRTDKDGEFTLVGLEAGAHEMEVRQVGYSLVLKAVQLVSGTTTREDVQLARLVLLDSVNVVAERSRYGEFEMHRKAATDGRFMDEQSIDRLHLQSSGDLIHATSGFFLAGHGSDTRVMSSRTAGLDPCPTLIFVDGIPVLNINDVPPALLGAAEFYPSSVGAPITMRYGRQDPHGPSAKCGTIVIWTKR